MKSEEVLKDFTAYCQRYPTLRFWQALRSWSRFNFIYGCQGRNAVTDYAEDTYYFEGKDK